MQTTNPTPSDTTLVVPPRSGGSVVKSFTVLSGALITKEIDAFADQVRKGIDNWRTAGKILVELSTRQPDIFRLIQARYPAISEATLQTFARIGRNELWPPLLADNSMGARKLLECPYDVQKEYAEKPIRVAISWRKGEIKTVDRKVSELSRAEVAVVFDGAGGVNTPEQQAWRLRDGGKAPVEARTLAPTDPAPAYKPARMVNVDIGYVRLVLQADGNYTVTACEKSAIAQPVRMLRRENGDAVAVVVLYTQEQR